MSWRQTPSKDSLKRVLDKVARFLNSIQPLVLMVATVVIAHSGLQAQSLSEELAGLEKKRDSVELHLEMFQRDPVDSELWYVVVSNHGLREVGIQSIKVFLWDKDGGVTAPAYIFGNSSAPDLYTTSIPGGGMAVMPFEFNFNAAIDLADDNWTDVALLIEPVIGEPAFCDLTELGLTVMRAGNTVTQRLCNEASPVPEDWHSHHLEVQWGLEKS